MKAEDLKKVIELNRLAKEWLIDFKKHQLGEQSQKLEKQKEMVTLLTKTNQILDQNGGAA